MLKDLLTDWQIILASASPRRKDFFEALDIPVKIQVKPIKEVYPDTLQAEEITNFLAVLKAEVFKQELKEKQILITSDTIVYNEGTALGKPSDYTEAVSMLNSLSGKQHEVITSVCFTTVNFQKTIFNKTRVHFRKLEPEEITYYVNKFEPYDKAGAYAIQEWIGLVGIEKIEGSYYNVVGLPTNLVYSTLKNIVEC